MNIAQKAYIHLVKKDLPNCNIRKLIRFVRGY